MRGYDPGALTVSPGWYGNLEFRRGIYPDDVAYVFYDEDQVFTNNVSRQRALSVRLGVDWTWGLHVDYSLTVVRMLREFVPDLARWQALFQMLIRCFEGDERLPHHAKAMTGKSQNAETSAYRREADWLSFRRCDRSFPAGQATTGRGQSLRTHAEGGGMSFSRLLWPVRRALRRARLRGRIWLSIGFSLTGLSMTPFAFAAGVLPQGGNYVAGAGTIAGQGNNLLITQLGSTRGVIDWNSFSIGKRNSVTFDNGSGATLNRVTGGSPSDILGRLSATGSLYLINPQGIIVGPSGVVATGGRFVASTLDICKDAFMQGSGLLTPSGDSDAFVINLGKISSIGGDIFLIARNLVSNAGTLAAPNGTVELAAGEVVLLQDSASSRQIFVQTGSQGTIVNKGKIMAAQVSLQAADGNVYALAGRGSRIRATGTANRDGHVWLVAESGSAEQLGKIAARNADGSGGTVDTQAAQLSFGNALVDAGQWNLSTPAFTIDDVAAQTLQRSLNAGTSVDLTTTGANGATGDLSFASSLRWSGPASLTLAAYRNLSLAATTIIANDGTGNLTLRGDATGMNNGGNVNGNGGTVDWTNSTGIISILSDSGRQSYHWFLLDNPNWKPPADSGLSTQITLYTLVNTAADLEELVSGNMGGNYALGRDIDASNLSFSTIGSQGFQVSASFSGQFDGMGHTISNITPSLNAVFGDISGFGVVRNLIVNARTGAMQTPFFGGTGILAINNAGKVVNVFTSGENICPSCNNALAGLVGSNEGLIERSGSSASVASPGYAAGLVFTNDFGGTIDQSYAAGSVTGGLAAGGLVVNNYGTINQSFATGRVQTGNASLSVAGFCANSCSTASNGNYWNIEATGQAFGGPNIPASHGLTTAQMSDPASFAGWDFGPEGSWVMPTGATYPVLRWQVPH